MIEPSSALSLIFCKSATSKFSTFSINSAYYILEIYSKIYYINKFWGYFKKRELMRFMGNFDDKNQPDTGSTQEEQKEQRSDKYVKESEIDQVKSEAENMKAEDIEKYSKHFSKEMLWSKIKKYAKKAGLNAVYVVLLLYYTMQKPELPLKVKAIIAGALGYFILPFDLIPDVAIGVGYVDDLSVLIGALIQVAMYIDEDVKKRAKEKLKDIFGTDGDDIDTSAIDNKLT